MAELKLLNEDGEISHSVNVRNLDNARIYIKDFNRVKNHKFIGKFKGKLINWDGKLIN